MTADKNATGDETVTSSSRLTLRDGGWLLVVSGVLVLAVAIWGLAGVFTGASTVGDGVEPATYGFILEPSDLRGGVLTGSGNPRDFLDALDDPKRVPASEVPEINRKQRGKFLVSTDRVIGIALGGEARAYPLRVMNAHEIVNDVLGGVPIAVTYSPLADSVVVFDRRVARADGATRLASFGVSGLVFESNLVLYDRADDDANGGGTEGVPSLWSQIGARPIAGPALAAGESLAVLPDVQLLTWAQWSALHPATEVILPDPRANRRYKEFDFRRHWLGGTPMFPLGRSIPEGGVPGVATAWSPMTPLVVLTHQGVTRALAFPEIDALATPDEACTVDVAGASIRLTLDRQHETVRVESEVPVEVIHTRAFAWFALRTSPSEE